MDFHQLKVVDIIKETPDSVVIELDVPSELSEKFKFLAGQYLTIKHSFEGKEIRRTYSLCSSPRSGQLKIGIKKVEGGVFSNFAIDILKVGDILEVAKPQGKFTVTCLSNNKRNYVLVAAGSGITPMMSILKTILSDEPFSKVYLFYGNQTPESTMFSEELNKFSEVYKDRFKVLNKYSRISSHDKDFGRIDGSCVEEFLNQNNVDKVYGYYLCGPENLIFGVRDYLIEKQGVDKNNVHFELFTASKKETSLKSSNVDFEAAEVSVKMNGKTYTVKVTKGEKILDVLLAADIDAPYSCQGGFCTQCQAKIVHGKVEMLQNLALSDQEISEGQTLVCQSIPKTEEILITYE